MADVDKAPAHTQEDQDRRNKETADKTAKEVQERVAKAYEIETPTPTQMENDLAKLSAMNMGTIPEGGGDPQSQHGGMPKPGDSGWIEPDRRSFPEGSDKKKDKQSEADKPQSGSYQTRAATPARDNATPSKAT
jgi:hypothetical protein